MAISILNNLYPPTVPTYGDPFIIRVGENTKNSGECIVPFSFSKYNNQNEIKANCIQVTVFKQNTNLSALDSSLYPCGIMLTKLDSDKDGNICIKIKSNDIAGSGFEINNFYRVQIRLTGEGASDPPVNFQTNEPQRISEWLNENEVNFSEWSTVCLIRGILQPVLKINNLRENEPNEPIEWKSSNVDIVGKLYFSAYPIVEPSPEVPIGETSTSVSYIAETDYLKEYSIKLYDENDNLVFDSGTIYTDVYAGINVNEINYTIKRIFKDGEQYKLEIFYLTKVGYYDTKRYYLLMLEAGIEKLNVVFNSIEDSDRGRITLSIKSVISNIFNGNLVIRRSDGDTGFTVWEDVAIISISDRVLDVVWHDYTVQSGKWYRYGVQSKNGDSRGILSIYNKDLMIEFDTIFLNADYSQIQIKYDPQISSFQHTIAENKIDTIGGKYPFIKRNGNMNYKQFPISGVITAYMDNYDNNEQILNSLKYSYSKKTEGEHIGDGNSLFTSKEQMYGEEVLSLYDTRMEDNQSHTLDTIIYEKDFRDKVKEFLYKNNVKLFRSATEGNILIKLMNITFTPKQNLGRAIWSFNATAYEMDECSIENYDKYNIQAIGSEIEHLEYIDSYIGQKNDIIPANTNVISLLTSEYQKYCKPNYIAKINKITYLKLEFNDKPYLIDMEGPSVAGENPSENTIVGHLVQINGKTIIVKDSGIYELKAEDVEINSIIFPVDTDVMMDYKLELSQKVNETKVIKAVSYKKIIGQLREIFDESQELISEIRHKYSLVYTKWYQELTAVNGMRIEADEGTICYVKEEGETEYQKHIIGPTESLDFYDPESVINSVYFYGMHLNPLSDYEFTRVDIPLNKFVDSGISAESTAEIQNPQRNNTYLINGQRKIYYRNNWYDIDNNNDIACPVAAMVDYYCECAKGYYAISD